MAKQDPQQSQRQQTVRANAGANRAAKEARERERQAELAREGRQQTLIGVIVAVVVIALVAAGGFFYWKSHRPAPQDSPSSIKQAYQAVQAVKVKPSHANSQGGFLLSKDGLGKATEGAPTVEVYMDFMCPGCASLNRSLDPTLDRMMDAGQLNVEIYPMSFMDRLTTDEYSARAGSAGIYILEHDSRHFFPYMAALYAKDFQPDETNYQPVSDARLKEQMLKAGVSGQVADEALKGQYKEWLSKMNKYTPMRSELWNTSGQSKGSMTTPTVRINKRFWPVDGPSKAGMDTPSGFLKSVGLQANQVGQAGVMPSIGAKGAPIALTASSKE
ncbi:DsbA family protein [Bifidobacterium xylocopae]|uniref:Disulfide bond formation protein DsbA n=1 Tax=Bifidobacterium xylocopae TaxID=2493119 RepID=A0A366KG64_9BIFI|nr:thioredoxin domain-containing protein [Bifidobacterium xylocopae]RBP99681.1 disulfide bond formation protein DsbA [Bifidobacterium xylocopae]